MTELLTLMITSGLILIWCCSGIVTLFYAHAASAPLIINSEHTYPVDLFLANPENFLVLIRTYILSEA
jgi:hypothetical protein